MTRSGMKNQEFSISNLWKRRLRQRQWNSSTENAPEISRGIEKCLLEHSSYTHASTKGIHAASTLCAGIKISGVRNTSFVCLQSGELLLTFFFRVIQYYWCNFHVANSVRLVVNGYRWWEYRQREIRAFKPQPGERDRAPTGARYTVCILAISRLAARETR